MDEGKNGSCEWSQMAGAQSSTEQHRTFSTSTKVRMSCLECALVFASEEKISFRLKAKTGMLSLVSHRSETEKIWSENKKKISEMKWKNRCEKQKNRNIFYEENIWKGNRTGNKQYEANIDAKRKRNEKLFNQESYEGRFHTCVSTEVYQLVNVLMYCLFIHMYICMLPCCTIIYDFSEFFVMPMNNSFFNFWRTTIVFDVTRRDTYDIRDLQCLKFDGNAQYLNYCFAVWCLSCRECAYIPYMSRNFQWS